jgi:uncharacterized protein YndB with AHSA1/START domain
MIRKLLAVLVLGVLGFLGYVAVQTPEFSVTRSATIAAPPEKVFQHIADFHAWQAWSPWAKRDPAAKTAFEGPASGKGAVFKWNGNDDVGEGQMTIVDAAPGQSLAIELSFTRPFQDKSDVTFDLSSEGKDTEVIWSIRGEQSFVQRLICTLMGYNMDKMIGADYEQGLASLKAVVEKSP